MARNPSRTTGWSSTTSTVIGLLSLIPVLPVTPTDYTVYNGSAFRHGNPVRPHLTAVLVLGLTGRAFGLDPGLAANQLIHHSWTGDAGFTLAGVKALAQTRDGYLWLGTDHGLVRFDGMRFVRWQPLSGQELPDSRILALAKSADGGLWIGVRGGIFRLHDGRLEAYTTRDGIPNGSIAGMVEDRLGRLWATYPEAPDGLIRIERGTVTAFGPHQGLPHSSVLSLFLDREGGLWVSTYGSLCRWNGNSAETCRATPARLDARSILSTANGLFTGTSYGLLRFGKGNSEPVAVAAIKSPVLAVLEDRHSAIWAATRGDGLYRIWHGRTELLTRLDGLSSNVILALLEDNEGNLWVGTANGLDRLREPKVARWSDRQGLAGNVVTAICAAHDGSLLVGMLKGGLNRIGPGSPEAVVYDRRFDQETIAAMYEDSKGRLWTGTNRRFGYLSQGRFQEVTAGEGTRLTRVFAIRPGPDDTLWLADAERGVQKLRNGRIEQSPETGLGAGRMYQFLADREGRLWLGYYQGGLELVDHGRRRVYGTGDGLAAGPVQAIDEGRSGAIWVGTRRGLSRFRKGRWTTWLESHGLPAGGIEDVIEDEAGQIWLISSSGLLCARLADLDRQPDGKPDRIPVETFGPTDGITLPDTPGYPNPRIAFTADGRLWVRTLDGLAALNPMTMRKNTVPPPVVIERLTTEQKPVAIGPNEIRLDSHSVEFEYTALSLTVPEMMRFRYRLEGFDKDWIDGGNRRQIAYANLPPRRFRFVVTACNNDGVWNEAGASLAFRCEPFFYQTWWFRALCVGATGLSGYLVYCARMRQLRLRFQLVLDERARMTRELHDTLLQGFTGVVLQLTAASRQLLSSPDEGRRRLDTALEKADQSLKEARQALSCMRLPSLENSTLPDALAAAGRQIVDGTPIRFHMEMRGKLRELPYEVQANLFIIAREAMSNAMNHANPGHIWLELEYAAAGTRLEVKDDGAGFDPEAIVDREGHFGLRGMRERARKIRAELKVESGVGKGTKVRVMVGSA